MGLLKAQGEYIWFVDQDDFIAPNSLGSILKICFQERLDILYFDYCNVSDDRTLKKKCNIVKKQTEVVSGLEYISQYCSGDFWQSDYDTNVWHSVYRRDFMVKNKVFSPEVSYCEDMIVSLNAIIVAKRIMAIESDYYCYRYNPASVFHTEVGVKGRAMFDASLYAGSEIIRLSKFMPSSYKNLCDTVKAGGIYRINSFTKRLLKLTCKQRCIFFELISRNRDVVAFCNDYLSSVNKWIITHSLIVQLMPHIIYLYVKLKKQS
ncbi:MAG: hypothetical protein IJ756_10030 [Paludibacteraceae bacterium]|nr:hypothetical protein [Paludibacteraceae bacterium]